LDTTVTSTDIAIRLAAAFAAGALLGYNRGEHGHAAGLRTTILVTLAATATMILAFALLPAKGQGVAFFTRMDVMRLPLGILSGIGFIGGGAILRRGDMVRGVTTASIIWITTVIGLVLGTGMIAYGAALTAISFVVAWGIKQIEPHLVREHRAILSLSLSGDGPGDDEIRGVLEAAKMKIAVWSESWRESGTVRDVRCELEWMSRKDQSGAPAFVREMATKPGVVSAHWHRAVQAA
jgi:putative Mg2+ transporter-C (MgtC) family protein